MASKLESAVEIYRSLGYEETAYENILSLGIGTKEEQEIAREGLKSGEWVQIKQLSENSYGYAPVVDVDLKKLAVFAVRIGVEAKRAANVIGRGDEISLQAIMARGENYAVNFISVAESGNRRAWEHSLSVLGMLCLKLLHRMNLPIPESVEYMKDWAAASSVILLGAKKDYLFDDSFTLEKEEILRRFVEHIEKGISLNMPATGPFPDLLFFGVEKHLLRKEAAKEYIFDALYIAKRPGDRKAWVELLDKLGCVEKDFTDRAENLIPLLGLGESPLIERFAPVLIENISEELLYPVLISCTSAKVKKTKKMLLNSVLKREKPKSTNDFAEWLSLYLQDEDKSIAGLAEKLALSWGIALEQEESTKELQGLWRESPKLWEVPRFCLGEGTAESLTDMVALLSDRKECVEDLLFEQFLALANQIAYKNPEEAKISLAGIPNSDSGILWTLGRWARGIETKPVEESRQRFWQGEKEIVKIEYRELLTMRRENLFRTMGQWPCLLSTPSFEDLSISVEDFLERLSLYQAEKFSYVSEPDLQLALTRLDVETFSKEDRSGYTDKLKEIDFKIQLPSGEFLQDEEGKDILLGELIEAYLHDPYIEPDFFPGETPYWKVELKMPESLKALPYRLSYSHNALFSIFPNWGDYSLTAVHRDFEVYHGQGIILRQLARRSKPLSKGALMNWIAVFGKLSDENAEDALKANKEAWERGLLLPGLADISYLDWSGGELSNLTNLAAAMDFMANEGMLSLVWKAACDTVEQSLKMPRILAGTAEIVKFLRDYHDEVILAVEKKLVSKEALEMKPIRTLEGKSGSSKAVSYAKEILEKLDSTETEQIQSAKNTGLRENQGTIDNTSQSKTIATVETPADFEKVWLPLPEGKELIEDHVTFRVKAIELRKNEKVFQFDLDLPEDSDCSYQVVIAGWLYGLAHEGQVSGTKIDRRGDRNDKIDAEKEVWLHYDKEKGEIVVSEFRNWRGGNKSPLEGEATPYSKLFLSFVVALLAQDGDSIYGAKSLFKELVQSGTLSLKIVRDITRLLLSYEEISPAKLVRIVEKESELLSICWGMLWECIKDAGAKTAETGKPPVWINRILDICIYYAAYLREAAKRGYISKEDALWPGLLEMANFGAKSTAVKKAKELAEILGIG
ncbi:PRTRC system protein E [Oribacterium sinus]|uniref:PRTRC system protein E n=1 Tax=Oribacterium sinus TaxID=237576 RepID=A0A930DNF3_9FIRM|nr:PRTRC system protein E [Oribacterium sinus]MBF1273070.1 PRTRC system protein E [Oribacterium sinus]